MKLAAVVLLLVVLYAAALELVPWLWAAVLAVLNHNNMKYTGERNSDGRPHGQGTETKANGTTYSGEWKDDKRHGKGTLTFANGDTYTGEFKDDKINGQGTATSANGRKYTGAFKDGKPVP